MYLSIEATDIETGVRNDKRWARLTGVDKKNRVASAVCFDDVAEAIVRQIANVVSNGETLKSRRVIVNFDGDWRDGKTFVKDGKEITPRRFFAKSFQIPEGPALERIRIQRDSLKLVERAEALREKGRLEEAYALVAEYVAELAGVPLDLADINQADQADDEDFGHRDEATASDPEARAARHFARTDNNRPVNEDTAPVSSSDALTDDDDVELSQPEGNDEDGIVQEEEAMTLAGDEDVLDDEPGIEEEAPEPVKQAAKPAPTPARPMGLGRPFSRPGLPQMARPGLK